MICPICCRSSPSTSSSSSRDYCKGNGVRGRKPKRRGRGSKVGCGGDRSRSLLEEFSEQLGVTHEEDDDNHHVMISMEDKGRGSKSENWTLCSECKPFVERAVEGRRLCQKVETHVNTLQLRILEELRGLRRGMTQFYLDLKEVEALARRGEDPLGEQAEWPLGTENSLRSRIFEALTELQDYQTELGTKLLASPELKNEVEEDEAVPTTTVVDDSKARLYKPEEPKFDIILMEEEPKSTSSDLKSDPGDITFEDVNEEDPSCDQDEAISQVESESAKKSDSDEDSEKDQNDDDDKGAPPPKKTKGKSKSASANGATPNISKISTLKDMFISKAESDQQKGAGGHKRCAELDNKMCFLKYTPETGQLTVGDIQLNITEESKSVQCGSCPFQLTWSQAESTSRRPSTTIRVLAKLTQDIIDHINGLHLATFNCSICHTNKSTRKMYVHHMNTCHGRRFPCDICGRSLNTNQGLINHRWSHMNEEERKEFIRNGGKVPPKAPRDADYPCSICQKVFKNKYVLKEHEKTHSGSNNLVICPVCGKSMTSHSYNGYHKIYKCPLNGGGNEGAESRVKCPHCPKTYITRKSLRYHIQARHGERNHLCSVCGKAFSTKPNLEKHFKTTHGEKLWSCRWGCGKEFGYERNLRRHEASCRNNTMNSNPNDADN